MPQENPGFNCSESKPLTRQYASVCAVQSVCAAAAAVIPAPPLCRAGSTGRACRPAADGAAPGAGTRSRRQGCTPPRCVRTDCRGRQRGRNRGQFVGQLKRNLISLDTNWLLSMKSISRTWASRVDRVDKWWLILIWSHPPEDWAALNKVMNSRENREGHRNRESQNIFCWKKAPFCFG